LFSADIDSEIIKIEDMPDVELAVISTNPSAQNGPLPPKPITLEDMPERATRLKKSVVAPGKKISDEELTRREIEKENRGLSGQRRQITAYVSGFIVKKVLSRVKCDNCKKSLLTDRPLADHDLVVAFERDDINLRSHPCY
jgi:ribosomal protein L44E